jgi:hypothetical protein
MFALVLLQQHQDPWRFEVVEVTPLHLLSVILALHYYINSHTLGKCS